MELGALICILKTITIRDSSGLLSFLLPRPMRLSCPGPDASVGGGCPGPGCVCGGGQARGRLWVVPSQSLGNIKIARTLISEHKPRPKPARKD